MGLLLGRKQIEEGREVVDRPRLQVTVQQLAELRDRVGAVRQQIVAAVVSCRTSQDRPGQSTRRCAPRSETDQARQGGKAG
ncbi:hypothetical protein ACFZA5_41375 [Streptomyces sp. NPDC008132]|uniref:hypothetical protein n=1 Tax=Streptomyces sp. NPDC008132 TaxID=3364812 RepID=UPI0036E8DF8E